MKRLPKGHKAQIIGTRMFQTMYTADQMREFAQPSKPLTDEQIQSESPAKWGWYSDSFKAGVRYAEAAHGIKGDA